MLCVLFKAAGQRYGVKAQDVDEVLPLVRLSPLPGGPDYLRGVMNLRGVPVPVADLGMLLCGRACRPWGSTRILTVRPSAGPLVGLLVERAMRTVLIDSGEIHPPQAPAAPYLAGIAVTERGVIEIIDPARLLPAELLDRLDAASEAS